MDTTEFQQQLVSNGSFPAHYGVHVTYIGEDGEILALGHPGRRRALAAANKMARGLGLHNIVDDPGVFGDEIDTSEKWAVPGHSEACPLVKAYYAWCQDIDATEETRPPVIEAGDEIKPEQGCGCEKRGDDEWWIRYCHDGVPGAFPVTVVGG